MNGVVSDLKIALRALSKRPVLTTVVVATLALGLGINTAIFSVVESVLLSPLPYDKPHQLVRVWGANSSANLDEFFVAPIDYEAIEREASALDVLAAYYPTEMSISDFDGTPRRVKGAVVTGNFFELLGMPVVAGRGLVSADAQGMDGGMAVVISHSLWASWFGESPVADLRIRGPGGMSMTVVGIAPASFALPENVEMWVPFLNIGTVASEDRWLNVVGRLRPGASIETAQAELGGIMASMAALDPERAAGWTVRLGQLHDVITGDVAQGTWILFAAAGLVLIVAIANVGNLLLARAEERSQEFAVRLALGAGRLRVARLMILENVVLVLGGAAIAVFVSINGVSTLRAIAPPSVARLNEIGVDGSTLLFVGALTVVTALTLGLLPVRRMRRLDLQSSLRNGRNDSNDSAEGARARRVLVGLQIALSLVLATGAVLLVQSFASLRQTEAGFRPEGLLSVEFNNFQTPLEEIETFYSQLVNEVRTIPGVTGAAATSMLPFSKELDYPGRFWVVGHLIPDAGNENRAYFRQISPGMLGVFETAIIRGRAFTEFDGPDAPGVVMINEAAASRYWPGGDPVGERLEGVSGRFGPLGEVMRDDVEIVGVVGDIRYESMRQRAAPAIYFPLSQAPFRRMTVVVRSEQSEADVIRDLTAIVESFGSEITAGEVVELRRLEGQAMAADRFSMWLVIAFGVVALVLALVGAYGAVAYVVAQNRRQTGIRLALGATPRSIVAGTLKLGLQPIIGGALVGATLVAVSLPAVSSLLFEISVSAGYLVFATVTVALFIVTGFAMFIPAIRGAKMSPAEVLSMD